ncbi:hypothetical protein RGQ29_031079 [Quercus rubra]|uniref:NADH-ubiquinone oxidoreductase chain 5 n=1 Tax=Quercus rubra TaxID=3512 RepID=A0AAN7IF55_QUERU|nr:hypothetical protein RGQ29_031079 [Quercus rubra]
MVGVEAGPSGSEAQVVMQVRGERSSPLSGMLLVQPSEELKRVSSHFPESQSYYSTLAKLMMKQDLDLFADDDDILAESEFVAPTITKLIPILFSTSGASVAYNVNPVADQFQRAFQTILNDFLVRSFLRFGYQVSFEALDKGAIEILGPYGISYTFQRLAERISQLQSGFVVRRGTSESSLLGVGSPLTSIPLHSIVSYCTIPEDIRGSSEWRFPCRELDEGRPSRPVWRAGISRPYYHYAFAILLGSTLFVTFSRMWDSLSSWVDNRSSFILIVSRFYNNK